MALRILMLDKKLRDVRSAYDELLKKDAEFATREEELEKSISEIRTEEERSVVEESVKQFESEKEAHTTRKSELEKQITDLEKEIEDVRAEAPKPVQQENRTEMKENKGEKIMENRTKFFGMNVQERDAFFAREEVKSFMTSFRTAIKDIRSIGNAGLTIPEVMLELMMPEIEKASVLMPYVEKEAIRGTARQVIMGTVPEAIWTEACATLNEMSLEFNDIDFDGYKVGGYYKVCNALLEDNDVELASKLIMALAAAIAKAVDKAIVYGTGVKQPEGIVHSLAVTTQPSDWPGTARKWEDLHTTHILTGTGKHGLALFQEIAEAAKIVMNDYSEGEIVWLMNERTHLTLKIEAAAFNAAAMIVPGMDSTMPIAGGRVVEYKGIPDGNIVFGYMKNYKLVERKFMQIGQSEHQYFIQDQTVFKATARYDGKPVIRESFAVLSINTTAPASSATFPQDTAN